MKTLGLSAAPASSQIVQRDRHAQFFSALALLGSSIEKFATEIRHLQRTEVREVEEAFGVGQKGSSAMPHKRNPVLSENLTGIARMIRATIVPALENVVLPQMIAGKSAVSLTIRKRPTLVPPDMIGTESAAVRLRNSRSTKAHI